jgi:orotate phosphoribosyltransferase
VVVLEDTLTRGGSALDAVQALEAHGAKILGVLTLVDREAGGSARIREAGYHLHILYTATELLEAAGAQPSP